MPHLSSVMPHFAAIAVAVATVVLPDYDFRPTLTTQPPPEDRQEKPQTPTTEKAPKHRTLATPQLPAGNDQTLQFLAWARERSGAYCTVRLDADGNFHDLNIHPCWPTSDEELERILELRHLESLSFYARWITNDGLRHLEKLPALKKLVLFKASQITDDDLERFKRANPGLEIELPIR